MKNNTGGIIRPLRSNTFRVLINDDSELALHVINCSFNFAKKEFLLTIRQSITKDVIEKIDNICIGIGSSSIVINALTPEENFFSIQLSTCKVIDHQFELDYANADIAKHILTFKYGNLKTTK